MAADVPALSVQGVVRRVILDSPTHSVRGALIEALSRGSAAVLWQLCGRSRLFRSVHRTRCSRIVLDDETVGIKYFSLSIRKTAGKGMHIHSFGPVYRRNGGK
jgi:hypothetical protein